MKSIRLAVFASGAGSTLRAVQEAIAGGQLPGIEIALVISNNSRSGAIDYARSVGIESRHISQVSCGDEAAMCATFVAALDEVRADYVLLAGYMKRVPDVVLARYENRVMNVHPALLPSFGGVQMYGDRVHEAVLARGCKVSGATVHFVGSEYDAGPIIAQQCCPVKESDTVESLRKRVQAVEVELVIGSLRLLAHNALSVIDNKVQIG